MSAQVGKRPAGVSPATVAVTGHTSASIQGLSGYSGRPQSALLFNTTKVITVGSGSDSQGFDPEEWPGELSTGSKQNGNDAEQWSITEYDLLPQDSDICPEYAHDAIDPRTKTPIEVKSCQIRYNSHGQRGRFQIWDYAHETLVGHGGGYIFVVHEPRSDQFHVYLHRPLSAAHVDTMIDNWHAIDHALRPADAKRTALYQSDIFTDISVDRIDPPTTDDTDDFPSDVIIPGPTQHERMHETIEAVKKIEEQHEAGIAPHEEVVNLAVANSGADPEEIEHQLSELKKRGEIYEAREDGYRKL